jgi:archaellum component FlaF (FlaF/FlaG flagellin family)
MLEHLTQKSLSEQLNTKFRLSSGTGQSVEVELVEVTDNGEVAGQTERFSALFRGSLEHFFQQGTYSLEHEQLGSFDLFIVPVRKDEAGFYYEAIFNRVK